MQQVHEGFDYRESKSTIAYYNKTTTYKPIYNNKSIIMKLI